METKTQPAGAPNGIPARSRLPSLDPRGTVSASLDVVRGLAAVLVLLQHTRLLFFVENTRVEHQMALTRALYFFTSLGHPSVMIFFVLSGFFISNSVLRSISDGRWSWSWYLTQRLTRLYVVLVPALILCAVADRVGIHWFLASGVYSGSPAVHVVLPFVVSERMGLGTMLGNALFLQGVTVPTFGSNGALWSLAYEFWYYVAFPALAVALLVKQAIWRRALWIGLALLVGVFIGRHISAYFLIWLMGLGVMYVPPLPMPHRVWRRAFVPLAGLLLIAVLAVLRKTYQSFPTDVTIGLAFALLLYGLLNAWPQDERRQDGKAIGFGIPKMFAGFSYTLYLVHLPILVLAHSWFVTRGITAWQPDGAHVAMGLGIAAVTLLLAWLVAQGTEARTSQIRRAGVEWCRTFRRTPTSD